MIHELLSLSPVVYMGQFLFVLGLMLMIYEESLTNLSKLINCLYIGFGLTSLLGCIIFAYMRTMKTACSRTTPRI